MRALLLVAAVHSLVAAGPLITVPIKRDGQPYALLDFYQTDTEYIIKTARQFCIDHGLPDSDLRMIVEYTLAQLNSQPQAAPAGEPPLSTTPPASQSPIAADPGSASLGAPAMQLLEFMRQNKMSSVGVMKALALLMEQGHTV
ncbi:MAG: hypothetical protein SGPRY_003985 [Prymnesium sp.]